jgi:Protein of unknown function (DUF2505)
MATTRTVTFDYPDTPADVSALLQDPVYLRYRSEAAGERNIEVSVQAEADGLRVTVAREKDVDIPAFARAIIGSKNRAVESTLWRAVGDRFSAEYEIQVPGLPVKTQGKSTFVTSASGCRYTSTFQVTARIPLVGGKIEALVADGLEEQMLLNAQRNSEALARNRERGPHSFIDGLKEQEASARSGS